MLPPAEVVCFSFALLPIAEKLFEFWINSIDSAQDKGKTFCSKRQREGENLYRVLGPAQVSARKGREFTPLKPKFLLE